MRDQFESMSDEELIARIREALARVDEPAVEAAAARLFDRYTRRVLGLVQSKMPPEAPTQEITQEVFAAATVAIFEGREIESFHAWIFRVARNKIADFWRGPDGQALKSARAAAGGRDGDGAPVAVDGVSTDAQDLFELEDLIESVLASLSETHRRIVELNVFEGLAAKDVAEATGESVDNVYQVVKRFRDRLRELLEDNDYEVGS